MITVEELMNDPDFCTTITRLRPTVAYVNEGERRATWERTDNLTAIIQPASTDDMKAMPEGISVEGLQVLWTASQIFLGDNTVDSDVVVYKGKSFRVVKSSDWSDNGYYQAFATYYADGVPNPTELAV